MKEAHTATETGAEKQVAAELRMIVATAMQACGCIAERAVQAQDVATCAVLADCLMACAGSEEIGSGSGAFEDNP